jgi:hypothetical protein
MILYSTMGKSFFWIAMGLAYALLIAGAPSIASDLELQMNWWKWLLSGLWYLLFSIGIAGSFTLMGEREPGAGKNALISTLVIMGILAVGLVFVLIRK